jgi:nitrite reductase/ring-hydroxylating ferredoxin subunit
VTPNGPPAEAATPPAAPEILCASAELSERGRAIVWDVLQGGQPARAFALRFDGRVVAYLNRCAHVPTEMDWQPGEFLDSDRRWILCSIHGAAYEPANGRCVGGPCGRGRLTALQLEERDGQVYWYPSRDTRPVPFDALAGEMDPPSAGTAPPTSPDR